jgi:hypothetical protein
MIEQLRPQLSENNTFTYTRYPQNDPVNPIPRESPSPSEIDFHRHFHNSSALPGPRLQLRNERISLILEGFLPSQPIRIIEEFSRREMATRFRRVSALGQFSIGGPRIPVFPLQKPLTNPELRSASPGPWHERGQLPAHSTAEA